jgi:hypothetical protein
MDRRKFFGLMVGGLATAAAARTFPFRVFSFPKEISRPSWISFGEGFFVDPSTFLRSFDDEELVRATEGLCNTYPATYRFREFDGEKLVRATNELLESSRLWHGYVEQRPWHHRIGEVRAETVRRVLESDLICLQT